MVPVNDHGKSRKAVKEGLDMLEVLNMQKGGEVKANKLEARIKRLVFEE